MKKPGTLRKLLRYLRPYGLWMLLSVLLAAGSVAGTLYIPILIGRAIDYIVAPGQVAFAAVGKLLATAAAVAGAAAVCQWVMGVINNRVSVYVVRDLRADAFEKINALPLSYLDGRPQGEIVSCMIADVEQLSDGLLLGATQLFTGVITILGTLAFMLRIEWKIALVVVLLTPISLFVAKFIAQKTYHMFRQQSEVRGEQTALMDEMLGNQKVVQAFSREENCMEAFDEVNDRLEKCSLRATFFSSLTNPTTRFVNALVYAAVALTGALTVLDTGGAFSVGALTSLLSYANQYTKPFNEISGVITELQNAIACAGRVFDLLEQPSQTPDAPDAAVLHHANGQVALRDVAFSYDPAQSLISNFNLSVQPGQRIAIVGPTGCGKTTLINLLMRFYDVDKGEICVDGYPLQALTRHSLRQNYGMVLQDTWLRHATVRENIAIGKPDATQAEIIAAAKASHADGFIRRLPNGYETVISEDGSGLSQGQKQLLCIARVMLCLPPMLILDEATSSIDTRTEIKIQQAFARMMQGRTSFIVAHRLSTVQEADVILVMRSGKIIEQGTHKSLLHQNGFYAQLYNSQFVQP